MSLSYIQSNTLYLSGSGVVAGATTITLTSLSDIYGNILSMADFGAKGYITLEPDTTNEEAATFTGVSTNANGTFTLTGVSTALAKSPYTETSGLVRSHAGGTKVVITDNAPFWASFANKNNNETILGTWTFQNAPVALSATPASPTTLGNVKLSSTALTALGTPTITIASPAVITLASHGLIVGDSVQFATTGTLPTGLVPSTNYYVIAAGLTTNTFEVSTTSGGSAVNTTGSQSGTHTLNRTTPFAVGNDDPRLPTAPQAQFLAATPGMITMFGGTSAPTGFLLCDGSAVSRTTNGALFAAIGTNWGAGDGSTTFNVPDLRSRTPVGKGVGTKVATFASRSSNVVTVTGLSNNNNNEFQTGQAVVYASTGTAMGGLTSGNTYYLVRTGNLTFSLATNLAGAQNSTLITLTSDGTGTQTFTLSLTTRSVGDTGGEENHAMSINEFLSHSHPAFTGGTIGGSGFGAVNDSTHIITNNTGQIGGNAAMNVMAPFAVVSYIIKT